MPSTTGSPARFRHQEFSRRVGKKQANKLLMALPVRATTLRPLPNRSHSFCAGRLRVGGTDETMADDRRTIDYSSGAAGRREASLTHPTHRKRVASTCPTPGACVISDAASPVRFCTTWCQLKCVDVPSYGGGGGCGKSAAKPARIKSKSEPIRSLYGSFFLPDLRILPTRRCCHYLIFEFSLPGDVSTRSSNSHYQARSFTNPLPGSWGIRRSVEKKQTFLRGMFWRGLKILPIAFLNVSQFSSS